VGETTDFQKKEEEEKEKANSNRKLHQHL